MPVGVSGAVALGVGAAGIAGSAISASAAESAAQTQANAAMYGANLQEANFQQIQQNLLPYMQYGQLGLNTLEGSGPTSLNSLTTPFNPTMAQLAATPGYQFTLQQGLQSVNNGLSSEGLAANNTPTSFSGAQQKGAANYAEGLASTTYNQQFQNYLAQNSQIYNMLTGVVGQGANAATGLGGFGTQTANSVSNLLTSGAAAQAAGTVGAANAIGGGLNSAANSGLLFSLLNSQNGNAPLFGGSGGGTPNSAGSGGNSDVA